MNLFSITQWLKQRRIPQYCTLCKQYHTNHDPVCEKCLALFTPIPFACTYCGQPLPESQFLVCGQCIINKPYVDKTIAPYFFKEPLRSLLHELKYHQGLYLTSFLARLMMKHKPDHADQTQCLIPIPLHIKRLKHRGFNQSAELAKCIAKTLNIPIALNACKKMIHTQPQASLSAAERQTNVLNAFDTSLQHLTHVTLIDDLLTTGSTANELAKTLKQKGIQHVTLWCCARS